MSAEVEAYRMLSSSGIPCPKVLYHDQSLSACPWEFVVLEFMAGISLSHASLTEEERRGLDVELGRYFREIHGLEGDGFGFLAQEKLCTGWLEFLLGLLDEIAERSERWYISPSRYIQMARIALLRNRGLFSYPSPRLMHNDLHDRNIIVRNEGTKWRIAAIIDPDRALFGDPVFELATSQLVSPSFTQGYGDVEEDQQFKRRVYNLLYDLREADVCLTQLKNYRVYEILQNSIHLLATAL